MKFKLKDQNFSYDKSPVEKLDPAVAAMDPSSTRELLESV